MLSKDDPIYYKTKVEELFKQARKNGLKLTLDRVGILFSSDNGDRVMARLYKEEDR